MVSHSTNMADTKDGLHNVKHVTIEIMGCFPWSVCRGLPKHFASCKPAGSLYTDRCTETVNTRLISAQCTAGKERETMRHIIRHFIAYTGMSCHAGQCVLAMVKDS